jgi:hypothetical protein
MNVKSAPASITPRTLRAAWVDQITSMEPTHGLTLVFNATVSLNHAQTALRRFLGHLDREMLGRRFTKGPSSRRTLCIAIPEHLHSNTHLHALLRVTPERHARVEHLLAEDRSWLWSKVAPAGTLCLKPLFDEGWARYCTKLLHLDTEVFITS